MLRVALKPIKILLLSSIRMMGYAIIKLPKGEDSGPEIDPRELDTNGPAREAVAAVREVDGTGGGSPSHQPSPVVNSETEAAMLPTSEPKDPALRAYRINMHHVGGRGGGFPFPMNPSFQNSVETYIYDADADCLEQMERESASIDRVIVAAVAEADEEVTFHVNHDPYTSSLLSANPQCEEFFYQDASCDYTLKDVLQPVKIRRMAGESLDGLAKRHDFQIDYLSLDVQGAEFNLLAGISDSVMRDTVAMMCEISFFQFYSSQHLFDELVTSLRKRGFFVARFLPHGYEWQTFRTGIGWRSTGFTAHGDTLFFRDIDHVVRHAPQPFRALLKLAFVSISFGNISYALRCLTEAYKQPDSQTLAVKDKVSFIRFLDDMYRLYRETPHIYPLRFPHIWSVEKSFARFEVGANLVPDQAEVRAAYFAETDEAQFKQKVVELLDCAPTPFESLLRINGFSQLADDVSEKRIVSVHQVLSGLGMAVRDGSVYTVPTVSA